MLCWIEVHVPSPKPSLLQLLSHKLSIRPRDYVWTGGMHMIRVWFQLSNECSLPHLIEANISHQWEGWMFFFFFSKSTSLPLLLYFGLWARHDDCSVRLGFLHRLPFGTFWLAEAAQVMGTQDPLWSWSTTTHLKTLSVLAETWWVAGCLLYLLEGRSEDNQQLVCQILHCSNNKNKSNPPL